MNNLNHEIIGNVLPGAYYLYEFRDEGKLLLRITPSKELEFGDDIEHESALELALLMALDLLPEKPEPS